MTIREFIVLALESDIDLNKKFTVGIIDPRTQTYPSVYEVTRDCLFVNNVIEIDV